MKLDDSGARLAAALALSRARVAAQRRGDHDEERRLAAGHRALAWGNDMTENVPAAALDDAEVAEWRRLASIIDKPRWGQDESDAERRLWSALLDDGQGLERLLSERERLTVELDDARVRQKKIATQFAVALDWMEHMVRGITRPDILDWHRKIIIREGRATLDALADRDDDDGTNPVDHHRV